MPIKREYSPEFGVGIAIVEKGKILLTRRRDYPVWCIPGGHLSPGESVLDAAVREAREETGLDVQITNFVGFYSLPHMWEKGSCEIIVLGKVSGGKLVRVTDETLDARYFSIDQLPSDLVGWQFPEAVDALSGKSGVLAVLDTHLSLRQLREQASRPASFDSVSSNEWLIRLCEHPKRYDPSYITHQFVQPDSIIPDLFNPQALNRYSYVLNNPVNSIDPTGHYGVCVMYDSLGQCAQWSGNGGAAGNEGKTDAEANIAMLSQRLSSYGVKLASSVGVKNAVGAYLGVVDAGFQKVTTSLSLWSPDQQIDFDARLKIGGIDPTTISLIKPLNEVSNFNVDDFYNAFSNSHQPPCIVFKTAQILETP